MLKRTTIYLGLVLVLVTGVIVFGAQAAPADDQFDLMPVFFGWQR